MVVLGNLLAAVRSLRGTLILSNATNTPHACLIACLSPSPEKSGPGSTLFRSDTGNRGTAVWVVAENGCGA